MLGCTEVNPTTVSSFGDLPRSLLVRIEREFHRCDRLVLLGEISLAVGWSLERTQQAVDVLVVNGTVRHATVEEKSLMGLSRHTNAYVLAVARCLTIAHSRP